MFQINDVVVYGAHGVCRIVGTQMQKINGANKMYFGLRPIGDGNATFYVPTWNEKALAKMRKVLDKQGVDALIDSMPNMRTVWIENESARKETYKQILSSGDQHEIISMIQAIYLHKMEREAEGKHLHISDECFMRDAEQLLYNEWQYVLNVDKAGLLTYIFERIESNK